MRKYIEKRLVIGDVHGCYEELYELLQLSGFLNSATVSMETGKMVKPGHSVIFVGDIIDRSSPKNIAKTFGLIAALFCGADNPNVFIRGNHDDKFRRWLLGNPVNTEHMTETIEAYHSSTALVQEAIKRIFTSAPFLYSCPDFKAVHAAYRPDSDASDRSAQQYALYGQVDKTRKDEDGYPLRIDDWKHEYKGTVDLLHGHTIAHYTPSLINQVFKTKQGAEIINLDGGCVFGGFLLGISYPEKKIHAVKAKEVYCESNFSARYITAHRSLSTSTGDTVSSN